MSVNITQFIKGRIRELAPYLLAYIPSLKRKLIGEMFA